MTIAEALKVSEKPSAQLDWVKDQALKVLASEVNYLSRYHNWLLDKRMK